ncbi:MAG TPA: hypothetical protein PKG54_16775 [Phycisphaerae bacterium]|jgi:hypothetical protein|nr:hypothetical protein [Phycisphaerae bacterium]HOB76169.1 hypothetical protein [Phycisphaerae bacterium]HOJ54592.1 hypothetical protein [Phycisphaerae bacterium]HOL27015.1 hypothetical protein [Phycisphaerae bacterium]HPP22795.1 hypothetical protein [Phycisphaerae bacterium]
MKKIVAPVSVVIIIGAIGLVVYNIKASLGTSYDKASYPYVCKDCKAVFDVQDFRKPGAYKMPKGAPSDSVATCLKCNKGWALPVTRCEQCGTQHVLYLISDCRCPKCFPEAAAAAKKAGVDTIFKKPG